MSKPEDELFKRPPKPGEKPPDPPKPDDTLPEEFKGKSPAELVKMVQEHKAKYDEDVKKVDERYAKLEALLTTPPASDAGRTEVVEDKVPDPRVDPEGYYTYLHRKNVGPLAQEAFERFSDIEKDRARTSFKDYATYEKEIEELMAKTPLELRAKRGSYEMAYRIAKSKHLDEREAELAKKGAPGFSEVPSAPARKEPPPRVELTEKETEVAKKMGITAEEYKKWGSVHELPPGA